MPSPRLTIRLPQADHDALEARAKSLGLTAGEAAKIAVVGWARGSGARGACLPAPASGQAEQSGSSTSTEKAKPDPTPAALDGARDRLKAEALPTALQLSYRCRVPVATAQRWLDRAGGSAERLSELSGGRLP